LYFTGAWNWHNLRISFQYPCKRHLGGVLHSFHLPVFQSNQAVMNAGMIVATLRVIFKDFIVLLVLLLLAPKPTFIRHHYPKTKRPFPWLFRIG
jgi:hypothetical protein